MDLEPLRKERPAITDEVTREFSPLYRLKEARRPFSPIFPPIYIARAGREEPGLNAVVDSLSRRLSAGKQPKTSAITPKDSHGFDVLDDNARTREIIRWTIEFIKAHG